VTSQDISGWMWAESCTQVERAERIKRWFFEPVGQIRAGDVMKAAWQSPIDIFEVDDMLWIIVVLPGVSMVDVNYFAERNMLIVSGERRLPRQMRRAKIHRMEIPHGIFARRIALPASRWALINRELSKGCLYLALRRDEHENEAVT